LAEREALLASTIGYYGAAERFAILAGDPRAAITAAEWGKGRAFAALLRDEGELTPGAAGAFLVVREGTTGEGSPLDALARSLAPGDVALSYLLLGANAAGHTEVAIGLVTRERATARLVEKPDVFCPDVVAFGDAIQRNDEATAREAGRRLYAQLLQPIAAEIEGARRLFVSPHLCLHALPWGALHDGSRFLVERFAFARIPPLLAAGRSAADDEALFGGRPRRWMIAADPAHPGEPRLPGLDALAERLADRVHPALLLRGPEVTPDRLLEGAGSVDVVAYAGHASYDLDAPLQSALLVAPSAASGADRVEARAVVGLGHRLDLVLLLGCETSRLGGRRPSIGDEAMGLQRAFLVGGARHVVGALWPVVDRDAEDFAGALLDSAGASDAVTAVAAAQRCLEGRACPARGIATWASYLVDAR
jgi:hypothetical protein